MKPESPFVSMEEAMATTGLTKLMIRFDVKNGYIPGEIDHRNRVVIRRTEWNRYLVGDASQPEERKPVGLHSIRDKSA